MRRRLRQKRWIATGVLAALALAVAVLILARPIHPGAQLAVITGAGAAASCASAPVAARQAGYCANTLSSTVFNASTVDMGLTTNPGFTWYFYGWYNTPTAANVKVNGSNAVVGESGDSFQATLSSATKTAIAPFYRGVAFGGGGYFEVTASFTAVSDPGNPNWEGPLWTSALEPMVPLADYQWVGQTTGPPPYGHFFEGDVIEYFQGKFGNPLGQYSATSHDWSGQNNSHDEADQHPIRVSQESFSHPHRYGMLWMPATVSSDGKVCYYYDGAQQACTTYRQFTNDGAQSPPSAGQGWEYGVIDIDHLVLIMGCANEHPCTINSVQVWQASAADNLRN